VAGVKLETQQFYSFGGAANPVYRPNRSAKTVAQITIRLIQAVYRIEPRFAKQKACQCPDSEVRIISRSHVPNFGIERTLENLLIWCGFGSEVRTKIPRHK
jgi:hypothetical protein